MVYIRQPVCIEQELRFIADYSSFSTTKLQVSKLRVGNTGNVYGYAFRFEVPTGSWRGNGLVFDFPELQVSLPVGYPLSIACGMAGTLNGLVVSYLVPLMATSWVDDAALLAFSKYHQALVTASATAVHAPRQYCFKSKSSVPLYGRLVSIVLNFQGLCEAIFWWRKQALLNPAHPPLLQLEKACEKLRNLVRNKLQ